jgi:arylformamidase
MSWSTLSRAARDSAYNNAAAVPNSQQLVRERNEKAAAYRATHTGYLDLAYAPAERTKWDIYPAKDPASPCLIFIHGGYWQMNRREDFAHFAEGVAAHGWSVAMPGYSLAPDATVTQIEIELRTALDWLAINGKSSGLAGEFYLSGWSAGGHLTAMLLDHPLITAGLAISGVFELGPIRDTYLNAKLNLSDDEVSALSPLRLHVIQKPLVIAYGTAELPSLVNDSRDLHALRAAAHAPGTLLPIPHADHFTVLDELLAADGSLVKALLTFAN